MPSYWHDNQHEWSLPDGFRQAKTMAKKQGGVSTTKLPETVVS